MILLARYEARVGPESRAFYCGEKLFPQHLYATLQARWIQLVGTSLALNLAIAL